MNKVIIFVVIVALGIAGLIGLTYLRKLLWAETQISSRSSIPSLSPEEILNESKIEEATKIDQTILDRSLEIRIIKKLPRGVIELESAYRQRLADACEPIAAKEPVSLLNWSNALTTRDIKRSKVKPLEFTRRSMMSVGLKISESDRESLPLLSRQAISDFLSEHYLSLQARVVKDPKSEKWFLHHRPLAAVVKFRSAQLTEDFVDPIGQTTNEIRGLGIYRPSLQVSDDRPQIAVWLFRSTWQKPSEMYMTTRYEFAFVYAVPQNVTYTPDQLALHAIVTSEQRTKFHYLKWDKHGRSQPKSPPETDLIGSVHFIEFANDGLHPKRTVTREGSVRGERSYSITDIENFMSARGLNGNWEDSLEPILEAIVGNELAHAPPTHF